MAILVGLIGLTVYLYFPIRSLANPIINWGDPDSLHRIIRHLMRKQYKNLSATPRSFELLSKQIYEFGRYLLDQYGPILLPVAILGWAKAWSVAYTRKVQVLITLVFLTIGGGIIALTNYLPTKHQMTLVSVFLIPTVLVFAIWIGFGILFIASKLAKLKTISNIAVLLICFLAPLLPLTKNFAENNQRLNTIAYRSGWDMLMVFPERAVLFTAGDFTAFPLAYLQMVEGYRQDAEIFDDYGSLFANIYGKDFLEMPGPEQARHRRTAQQSYFQEKERPIYCTLGADVSNWTPILIPEGLNYRCNPLEAKWSQKKFWVISSVMSPINKFNESDNPTVNIMNQYLFSIGEYYFSINDKENGLKFYRLAGEKEKEYEWLANNMATMLPRHGMLEYSKEFYHIALELNPYYTQAYIGLGNIALVQKRHKEAENYFKKALVIEPNIPLVHFFLGNIYSDMKKPKEAIEEYIRTVSLDPGHVSAFKNLASAYFEIGDMGKALEATQRAININPNDSQLFYNLGAIYRVAGNLKLAEMSWFKSYQLNPKDEKVIKGLQELKQIQKPQ